MNGLVKNNKKIIVGTGTSKINLFRPKIKAAFFTRFELSTSADITVNLDWDAISTDVLCTKLKTKKEIYSSFHLAIPEVHFDKIMSYETLPSGVLVLPFYRQFKAKQKFCAWL